VPVNLVGSYQGDEKIDPRSMGNSVSARGHELTRNDEARYQHTVTKIEQDGDEE